MESKHEQAERDYLLGMKYKDIAVKYGVSLDTVKSWKRRYWKGKIRAQKQSVQKKWANPKGVHETAAKVARKKALSNLPKITNSDPGLTENQRIFCLYWINNRNATQAYLKAYGCSRASADTQGPALMGNPRVRAEIDRLREIKARSIMLGPDDIVERYMRLAFADFTDFADFGTRTIPVFDPMTGQPALDEEGNPRTRQESYLVFKDSETVDGAAISEASLGRAGMKIKLENRQKALEWLAAWFAMNPMDKHKMAYDNAMLAIRKKELELKDF